MSDPRFVYTKHAQDMLGERDVKQEWVELTVDQPEAVETDPERPEVLRAFRTIPERGSRILRVAYVLVGKTARIITVFFDRRRRRTPP